MKIVISAVAIVALLIGTLSLVILLSVIQQAYALSVFAHNKHIPFFSADVRYIVRDFSIRHLYIFHKHLSHGAHAAAQVVTA